MVAADNLGLIKLEKVTFKRRDFEPQDSLKEEDLESMEHSVSQPPSRPSFTDSNPQMGLTPENK